MASRSAQERGVSIFTNQKQEEFDAIIAENKRLKHELVMAEQRELKKIKNIYKIIKT